MTEDRHSEQAGGIRRGDITGQYQGRPPISYQHVEDDGNGGQARGRYLSLHLRTWQWIALVVALLGTVWTGVKVGLGPTIDGHVDAKTEWVRKKVLDNEGGIQALTVDVREIKTRMEERDRKAERDRLDLINALHELRDETRQLARDQRRPGGG